MKNYRSVQYELLRPGEVKSIREATPIVYIPAGSLEWHGVHNPLGTDALKAHLVCCEAALQYGGVVLPPLYLGILGEGEGWGPEGWSGYTITVHDEGSLEDTIFRISKGLVANGWKTIVGVTGHDINEQRDSILRGIRRACLGTDVQGFSVKEGENWNGGKEMTYHMDHAGLWETSFMMYGTDNCVNLNELEQQMKSSGRRDKELLDMKEPEGIGGINPLFGASEFNGLKMAEFCGGRIGRKARSVLTGDIVPPENMEDLFSDNDLG